jgi:shikimate dehydrogenase
VSYAQRDTPLESLDTALAECASGRIGGNVTMPLKSAVAERAARLSDLAQRVGAVNTFWFEQGALIGHNTDVDGARASVAALAPIGGHDRVVLLGAGGAAGAVLLALESLGIRHVAVASRSSERATQLLERVGTAGTVLSSAAPHLDEWLSTASLVINATPLGMTDDTFPVDLSRLGPDTAVFDLVYRRGGTAWVRAAHATGRWAEDGQRMLVEQGASAFTCWFGVAPDRAAMWGALASAPPPTRTP